MRKIKNRFTKILYFLEKEKIKYIITGGIAVIIYGYLRATKDIDLILDFKKDNIEKFLKIMKKFGFIPRVPIDFRIFADKKERDKKVITFDELIKMKKKAGRKNI